MGLAAIIGRQHGKCAANSQQRWHTGAVLLRPACRPCQGAMVRHSVTSALCGAPSVLPAQDA